MAMNGGRRRWWCLLALGAAGVVDCVPNAILVSGSGGAPGGTESGVGSAATTGSSAGAAMGSTGVAMGSGGAATSSGAATGSGGAAGAQPRCAGLTTSCGPNNTESCCATTSVPAGTFDRGGFMPPSPATLSAFSLDRFEVTVGRFRAFVAAYPGSKPAAGAGANPNIPDSGWDASWPLPSDAAALTTAVVGCGDSATWTSTPTAASEALPMNCLDWYTAFAFCAWDGGRLPTEAEWYYAASGGNQQRQYPWSTSATSSMLGPDYALYDCIEQGCSLIDVGSESPLGDGLWGQADLGGSVWEWNLDWFSLNTDPYVDPTGCNDCANLDSTTSTSPPTRVLRGGSWLSYAPDLANASRSNAEPNDATTYGPGVRCAR
jgi:sulfatase modifying factor 1